MTNDVLGDYIATFLKNNKAIRIATRDRNWIEDIYLPKVDWSNDRTFWVSFKSDAQRESKVHYGNKTTKITKNSKLHFRNDNDRWYTQRKMNMI